jgi:hypothetical protein
MPLIDNKGYSKLKKNNTPAKPTVTVMLIVMAMATAMAAVFAFNDNGVFPEKNPFFVQAHKKDDVPSFPIWCCICHNQKS